MTTFDAARRCPGIPPQWRAGGPGHPGGVHQSYGKTLCPVQGDFRGDRLGPVELQVRRRLPLRELLP